MIQTFRDGTLVYGIAAVIMLAVVVVAILVGLALRLVAEFLLELATGSEEGR